MDTVQPTYIKTYSGNDYSLVLPVIQGSSNTPIDLTGYTFYLTVKIDENDLDTNSVIKKDILLNGTTDPAGTDAAHGLVVIPITHADSVDLKDNYVFDVQYKDTRIVGGTNAVKTVMNGIITFKASITDRSAL